MRRARATDGVRANGLRVRSKDALIKSLVRVKSYVADKKDNGSQERDFTGQTPSSILNLSEMMRYRAMLLLDMTGENASKLSLRTSKLINHFNTKRLGARCVEEWIPAHIPFVQ